MMKKWFWLLCLPLMMFSCDFFSDGEDDDDGLIIDPPETFSFFYDLQAIAGDTLTLTTYTRLVDPKVFLNDMPMEVTVLDRLPDGMTGDGNMPVSGSDAAYYVKVSLPASLQGEYELRVAASRADSPQMGELSLLLGYVYVYTMQADDLGEFNTGRPAWVDLSDALALMAEYNSMDRNGNPVSTASRRTDFSFTQNDILVADTLSDSRPTTLTDEEVAMYSRENVLKGNDDWDATTKISVPAATDYISYNLESKLLTWTATEATA